MDIDMSALRAIERERDLRLDVLVEAIEQALLVAYHHTEGAYKVARVELDRSRAAMSSSGLRRRAPHPRRGPGGSAPWGTRTLSSTTPGRFSAGSPRPRRAGHPPADARPRGRAGPRRLPRPGGRYRLGDHPAGPRPANRPGRLRRGRGGPRRPSRCRGALPPRRAAPVLCRQRQARTQGPTDRAVPNPSQPRPQALRLEVPRSPTARWRSPRWRARPATAARSPSPPRSPACGPAARASDRWAHGSGPSWPSCAVRRSTSSSTRGPSRLRRCRASPAKVISGRDRRPRRARPGSSSPTTSSRWRSAGGPERAARRQAHRVADRHPFGHRAGTSDPRRQPTPRFAVDRADRSVWTPSDGPHSPSRTCVGCRRADSRSALLRVVAALDQSGTASVVPDVRGRLPGRGAWLHPTLECLEHARRRRAFGRPCGCRVRRTTAPWRHTSAT